MKFFATMAVLSLTASVSAEPIHVSFTSPDFAICQGSYSCGRLIPQLDREVTLDSGLGLMAHYSDDGIGITGSGYEDDELETNERLTLRFNEAVNVTGFNVTDLFLEHGYLEWGTVQYQYGDGSSSLFSIFTASPNQPIESTNGLLSIAVNQSNVLAMIFAAPGLIDNQHHEFSLAGVTVENLPDLSEVPEPTTLILLGTGLLGLFRLRKNYKVRNS